MGVEWSRYSPIDQLRVDRQGLDYLKQTSIVIKEDSSDPAECLRRNYSHYEKYLEKKASNIHEKTKQIIEEENQRESKLDNFLNFLDSWYDRDGNTLNLKPLPILVPLSKKNQYILENFFPASKLKEFIVQYRI